MSNRDRRTIFTLNDLRAAFAATEQHPTPISRELYDRASAEGFDMKGYVVIEPRFSAPPYMSGHQIQTRYNPE